MTINKMLELIKAAPGLDDVLVTYSISNRCIQLQAPIKDAGIITSEVLESLEQVFTLFNLKTKRWVGFDKADHQYFMLYLEGEMDTVFLPILRIVEKYRDTYAEGSDLQYVNDGIIYNIAVFCSTEEAMLNLDKFEKELIESLKPFGKKIIDILAEDSQDGKWFWAITLEA